MGFNRSIFNREPFNIPIGLNSILGNAEGTEVVDCSIGSALNFHANSTGYERIDTDIDGNPAWIKIVSGAETVAEMVLTGDMYALPKITGTENVASETILSADIITSATKSETITKKCKIGANITPRKNAVENVFARMIASAKIISPTTEGYEFVDESASLENIDIKTCYLNVTLKPNQVLIVDANTYNVLLNSQNAIDIQSGDWIDELNRNTVDIKIEAASGSANLDATILYTERFL